MSLKFILLVTIISVPAWIYLGYYDWKLALALILIMTGNNMEINKKIKNASISGFVDKMRETIRKKEA